MPLDHAYTFTRVHFIFLYLFFYYSSTDKYRLYYYVMQVLYVCENTSVALRDPVCVSVDRFVRRKKKTKITLVEGVKTVDC